MFFDHPLYTKDIEKIINVEFPWEKLRDSKILITGATGMIGTVLVDVLMERNLKYQENIQIFARGRSRERALERFGAYMEDTCFHFLAADINTCTELQVDFDYLFHCASNTHPTAYATDPIGTIVTNVIGTNNVLQLAAKSNSKRVVFLSSVEVYGENRGDTELFDEKYLGYIDCNTLRAGYPEGKRTGEALCQAYIKQYGLDIVIPRISRVFGPTMLSSDSKALSQFIKKALSKEDIVLKSEGTQYFSYCYVTDVVRALLYILFYGDNGQAYNIADEKCDIRLKDLARNLADIAGTKVIFELPDSIEAQGYSKATVARLDASRIKDLGWYTEDTMYTLLEKTIKIMNNLE